MLTTLFIAHVIVLLYAYLIETRERNIREPTERMSGIDLSILIYIRAEYKNNKSLVKSKLGTQISTHIELFKLMNTVPNLINLISIKSPSFSWENSKEDYFFFLNCSETYYWSNIKSMITCMCLLLFFIFFKKWNSICFITKQYSLYKNSIILN